MQSPMRNQEADNLAKKLIENFITIFGVPMQIHTDQGTNFESNLFKALYKYLDIEKNRQCYEATVGRHGREIYANH